ncbi:MAG: 3-deoxy-manno-octulosonate cytidylyltransferase [Planctomycetota bacterium]
MTAARRGYTGGLRTLVLIPARRASTRLPEKLLLAEHGEPLIATVARRAAQAFGPAATIVCADDPALVAACAGAGVQARMTRLDHQSGTDRIAEVAAGLDADIVVNVQGDEPEMDVGHIRLVAGLLERHPWAGMATLGVPMPPAEQADPSKVKLVLAESGRAPTGEPEGRALWFTRAPAPWDRDAAGPGRGLRHLGIYAYRRDVLLGYGRLPASALEQSEKLEQLRALAAGIGIAAAVVAHAPAGIDTRPDYDAFLARHRNTP